VQGCLDFRLAPHVDSEGFDLTEEEQPIGDPEMVAGPRYHLFLAYCGVSERRSLNLLTRGAGQCY
jgi:hypothetical protein